MIKQVYRIEDNVIAKIVDGLRTGNYDITSMQQMSEQSSGGHCITTTTTVDIVVQGFRVTIEGERIKPSSK